MSEPMQSIAQNNYILHNIDAKKLYVQEPLFTANSGDAVYVGWRPDETVLFETTATSGVASATLSEPLTNFERVKIKFGAGNDANMNVRTCYNEFDTNCWQYNLVGQRTDDAGIVFGVGAFSAANNYTELHRQYGKYYIFLTGNTVNGPGNLNISLFKVIGINRKENA